MFRLYRGDNWVVRETPSQVSIRERLSNGQYLTMRFWRVKAKGDIWGHVVYVWKVSVHIGSKKEARRWRRRKKGTRSKQTGNCGLEGLREAQGYLLRFAMNFCGWRDELQIDWEDDKRRRAYRWLVRHPGFALYVRDGKEICYAFRHPDLYEWEPNDIKGDGNSV